MKSGREIENWRVKSKAKHLVERYGKEKCMNLVVEIIHEKHLSSSQTYWIRLKKEIEKL